MSQTSAITSPADRDAPTFREPWQAKAFAMVVLLHRQGRFEWNEWVQVLGAEIAAGPQQPGEDPDAAYHRQFLAALERIVAALGIANADDQLRRKEEWPQCRGDRKQWRKCELCDRRERQRGSTDREVQIQRIERLRMFGIGQCAVEYLDDLHRAELTGIVLDLGPAGA